MEEEGTIRSPLLIFQGAGNGSQLQLGEQAVLAAERAAGGAFEFLHEVFEGIVGPIQSPGRLIKSPGSLVEPPGAPVEPRGVLVQLPGVGIQRRGGEIRDSGGLVECSVWHCADFQSKVDALADGYETARGAQMPQKGGSADTRGNRDDAKLLLQNRLFDNLLFVAVAQKDPDKCALYFNQALLEDLAAAPGRVMRRGKGARSF